MGCHCHGHGHHHHEEAKGISKYLGGILFGAIISGVALSQIFIPSCRPQGNYLFGKENSQTQQIERVKSSALEISEEVRIQDTSLEPILIATNYSPKLEKIGEEQ